MTQATHPLITQVGMLAQMALHQAGQETYQQTADPTQQSVVPKGGASASQPGGPGTPGAPSGIDWQGVFGSLTNPAGWLPGGGAASQALPGTAPQPGGYTTPGGALPEQAPTVYHQGPLPGGGGGPAPVPAQVTCPDGSVHPAGYACPPPESFLSKYWPWLAALGVAAAGGYYLYSKRKEEHAGGGGHHRSERAGEHEHGGAIARFHRAYSW